jgi:hypothetical protein
VGIDHDADAFELSPGPRSGALSLADEAVQLGKVVPVQRESRRARLSSVLQDLGTAGCGTGRVIYRHDRAA